MASCLTAPTCPRLSLGAHTFVGGGGDPLRFTHLLLPHPQDSEELSSLVRSEGPRGLELRPRPQQAPRSRSLVVHIHGGGFVAQTSKSPEPYLKSWAQELGVPILSIDYSLAPEAPFPRALEECFYAYCWAVKHCGLLGEPTPPGPALPRTAGGTSREWPQSGSCTPCLPYHLLPPSPLPHPSTPLVPGPTPPPSQPQCPPLLPQRSQTFHCNHFLLCLLLPHSSLTVQHPDLPSCSGLFLPLPVPLPPCCPALAVTQPYSSPLFQLL